MADAKVMLNVDLSDLQETIEFLRGTMTQEKFATMIRRTYGDAARRTKGIIGENVPKQYRATSTWAKESVLPYKLQSSGASVKCIIPLMGQKGTVGGRFKASGPFKSGRIKTYVLKGKASTLPAVMKNQGGNAPFINRKSEKLNGVAFTRKTNERFPIVRVVALAAPQMPMNRSEKDVSEEIEAYAFKRLEHHFNYLMKRV